MERLAAVASLGATAIEIMPVADFPGGRSWGYDGVDLFAPARAYGRPDDFRRLVDAAHRLGLAVFLDVVYNHLGPEGAYLFTFGHYATSRHRTPWGDAVNLDGPGSREVRRFFIENALRWLREYHIDGLRLDATHALKDSSSPHFVAELTRAVRAFRPGAILIAEDERKRPGITRSTASDGWGLDGMWADDFHHHVRRLLAGDREGYYAPYSGTTADIALTVNRGWWFREGPGGQREWAHTVPAREGGSRSQFVFCLQNHDQVGNRAFGHRLHHDIDPAAFRAATVLLLLAPETPLLFMGQEWAASAPFLYFTDLPEPLGTQVTNGRREEFRAFRAFADPAVRARIPDPQSRETFEASRLDWEERAKEPHASVLRLHEALLAMRRSHRALKDADAALTVEALNDDVLAMRRAAAPSIVVVVRLTGSGTITVPEEMLSPSRPFQIVLSTEEPTYTESLPISVDVHGGSVALSFSRPGAIVFEST
jgi:maltooligosyltrehalose trehalohydrolase